MGEKSAGRGGGATSCGRSRSKARRRRVPISGLIRAHPKQATKLSTMESSELISLFPGLQSIVGARHRLLNYEQGDGGIPE